MDTHITLPPGPLPHELLRRLLRRIFEQFHWFEPARYGFPVPDESIPPGRLDLAPIMALYDDFGAVSVGTLDDHDYLMIFPSRQGDHPYAGAISWVSSSETEFSADRFAAQLVQVAELMREVDSPLAYAAIDEDIEHKARRWIRAETGETRAFTVRDYSEGLAGLFWRNFYGPPFVHLFGERLNALPPECVTRLGEELVLVQPYALPTEAGTQAARAREQQLISLLGPECFYDHEHHRPPTRRPVLPPPPWSPPAT